MIPYVIEQSKHGERAYDVYSKLLEDRIVVIRSEITDEVASSVIAQLLLLNKQAKERHIELLINSPGGSVTAGLGILDVMNFITADIMTICVGNACSMAAHILAAGTKGLGHSAVVRRVRASSSRPSFRSVCPLSNKASAVWT